MKSEHAVNIHDLAKLARKRLPRVVMDYLEGGAEDEITVRANRDAFAKLRFRPRILTANARRDLSVALFGQVWSVPFMIGPTGLNGIHWRDADVSLARAATAAGTAFALSTASTNSIEEVGACTQGHKWFQLYPWADRAFCSKLLERAKAAGFSVLLVTVDSVNAGRRERDARNRFSHEVTLTPSTVIDGLLHPAWLASVWIRGGGMPRMPNLAEFLPPGATAADMAAFTRSRRNPLLDWRDMEFLKREWAGPMLIKGVLTADDARLALDCGADGVVVSNHGGRQLDGAMATIEALPEIVEAAGDAVVLIDGGIRRGADVLKALALGARGVLLGRATLYGLAAAGQAGVSRALSILTDEFDRAMALLGCSTIAEVGRDHVTASCEFDRRIADQEKGTFR